MPVLPGLLVPRQLKSSMKSLQHHLDEGTSPLANVPPEAFALLMADQLEAVRAGGKGITNVLWLQHSLVWDKERRIHLRVYCPNTKRVGYSTIQFFTS